MRESGAIVRAQAWRDWPFRLRLSIFFGAIPSDSPGGITGGLSAYRKEPSYHLKFKL